MGWVLGSAANGGSPGRPITELLLSSGVAGGSGWLATDHRLSLRFAPFRGDFRLAGYSGRIPSVVVHTSTMPYALANRKGLKGPLWLTRIRWGGSFFLPLDFGAHHSNVCTMTSKGAAVMEQYIRLAERAMKHEQPRPATRHAVRALNAFVPNEDQMSRIVVVLEWAESVDPIEAM